MSNFPNILIVDDSKIQLQLIEHHLKSLSKSYKLKTALSGKIAWEILNENPEHYDVILLDRGMPDMDGIELLTSIRNHQVLKNIPVILQTAKNSETAIIEGMKAGAYYYLIKPFSKELLLSVIETALNERLQFKTLSNALSESDRSIQYLKHGTFEFKTIYEANLIAGLVAKLCPNPENAVTGLAELLINAVEHGNLNISYAEKSTLQLNDNWQSEIDKRLSMQEYKNKIATIDIKRHERGIDFVITDEGLGFDWEQYLDFSANRMLDSHGRGIAMANKLSFSRLEYRGKGNIVSACIDFH